MRDSYTAPYNIANPNTNNKTALILSPRMTLGWETRSRTYSTAPSAHRASILTRCHLQYFHKTTTRLYRVYRASRSSREKTEHQQMQQLQNIEDFFVCKSRSSSTSNYFTSADAVPFGCKTTPVSLERVSHGDSRRLETETRPGRPERRWLWTVE